jgi:septal ring factor EnvC (AmiA/AmiB activator)
MDHITPERLKLRREKNLNELRGSLTDLRSAYSNLNDQRAYAKDEVDRIDREIYDVKADSNRIGCEIEVWENLKIYLSAPDQVERAERARKDPCQRGLELAGDEL